MNVRTLLIPIVIAILSSGCATIVDVDPEKLEMEQIRKIKGAQAKIDPFAADLTAPSVRLGQKDRVSIHANKQPDIKGPQDIKLQSWRINVVNSNVEPKCVTIAWKLMDFSFDSNYPYEFYMAPDTTIHLGNMHQSIWDFDGVGIALPPSGYVQDMRVRDPEITQRRVRSTVERDELCNQPEEDAEEDADEF